MTIAPDVDLDISARSFWAKPYEEREQTFAWLRANEPVSYHRPYESTLVPPEGMQIMSCGWKMRTRPHTLSTKCFSMCCVMT